MTLSLRTAVLMLMPSQPHNHGNILNNDCPGCVEQMIRLPTDLRAANAKIERLLIAGDDLAEAICQILPGLTTVIGDWEDAKR